MIPLPGERHPDIDIIYIDFYKYCKTSMLS